MMPDKIISPGVAHLVPKELQDILWALFEANPLLPSVFGLQKGRKKHMQHINHMCLPYYDEYHTVEVDHPLNDLRITIKITDSGLMMRLSNHNMETAFSQLPSEPEQGELF